MKQERAPRKKSYWGREAKGDHSRVRFAAGRGEQKGPNQSLLRGSAFMRRLRKGKSGSGTGNDRRKEENRPTTLPEIQKEVQVMPGRIQYKKSEGGGGCGGSRGNFKDAGGESEPVD